MHNDINNCKDKYKNEVAVEYKKTMDMEQFVFKKTLIFYIVFTIIIVLLSDKAFWTMLAFTSGVLVGCIKLFFFGKLLSIALLSKHTNSALVIVLLALALIILYGIAMFSAAGGLRFFVFFIIGFLLNNFVVFVNSITELLGLTKNNFHK